MSKQGKDYADTPIALLMVHLSPLVIEAMGKMLGDLSDIRLVDPPANTSEMAKRLEDTHVDVVLMGLPFAIDIYRSAEVVSDIRARHPHVRLIAVLERLSYETSVALFRAGVNGILSATELSFDLLCKSVRCVYQGEVWASNPVMKHLIRSLHQPQTRTITDSKGRLLLTRREEHVLQLLAEGFSNMEIAAELKISGHTIKNHLFRIYDKLGVSNRMEAVLYVLASRGTGSDARTSPKSRSSA